MATRMGGKIAALEVERNGARVFLDNDPSVGPKDNAWRLKIDHTNYNALYSLVLAAFANRWKIVLRIEGDEEIKPTEEAAIRQIGIDAQ